MIYIKDENHHSIFHVAKLQVLIHLQNLKFKTPTEKKWLLEPNLLNLDVS
jgi:hypothetical protein